jgi:hypothetical protein
MSNEAHNPASCQTAVMGSSDLRKSILKELKFAEKDIKKPYDTNHKMWLMGKIAAFKIILIGLE